jgi:hypothetical protein
MARISSMATSGMTIWTAKAVGADTFRNAAGDYIYDFTPEDGDILA